MQHMSLLMATKRKVWVPSLQDRHKYGDIQLMNALRNDDLITDGQHLNNFLRLSHSDVEYLFQSIDPIIRKANTNCRTAISPLERLLVTLRFLARRFLPFVNVPLQNFKTRYF